LPTSADLYQREQRFFAQVGGGAEKAAADELRALGATDLEEGVRGIHFGAPPQALYAIVYAARLPQRIIAPLAHFRAHDADYLFRQVREMPWEQFLRPKQTLAVFANVANSRLRDSRYVVQRVKDGICDHLRESTGERPSVDIRSPHLWVSAHVSHDAVTLGIDLSGGSMHRRGYRLEQGEAPMQETVAAAVIELSGWASPAPLYDPMCGAGTLLAEAWLKAAGIPAGFLRDHFGLMQMPDFDLVIWTSMKKGVDSRIEFPPAGTVRGSDIDPAMVAASRANLARLPGGDRIEVRRADLRTLSGLDGALVVSNPPYGLRMQAGPDIGAFTKEVGDWLKFRSGAAAACLYFGERELLKHIGLRAAWKAPLRNGGLDGRLARFDLYGGKRDEP
jgi:putative N6-adenine-specific DNA methylase